MIAQMLNVVIPIRIGELARIALMKQSGQAGATTLATIALEKSLDLAAAGLIALTLAGMAVAPDWIQSSASGILILGIALIVGLLLVWRLRAALMRWIERGLAVGGILPAHWQARLLRIAQTLLQSFGMFTDARALLRVAFWTALVWAMSPLAMLALFVAFNFPLTLTAALVLMLAFGFSNLVPSPPALIGVTQAVVVFVLGEYGIAPSLTLGYGIVLNIVMVAPLIVLGCWGLGQRARWSFAKLQTALAWARGAKR